MSARKVVLFVIPCALVYGISTNETDCKTSRDCQLHEICDKSFCQCAKGYVRYIFQCVPVKIYGEECSYDIECNDFRMVCTNEDHDVQQKRFCVCDTYHIWNSTIQECLEISNMTQISGNFREIHNVKSMIERSAQKVFLGVVVAGLIFVSILLSFIGICSVYGCCTKHKKGRYGEDDLGKEHINEVAVIGLPTGTYEAIETDFSESDVFLSTDVTNVNKMVMNAHCQKLFLS